MIRPLAFATAVILSIGGGHALAADKINIGVITTLSGSNGVVGKHVKDGIELALKKLDRKVGGVPAEAIFGDDQLKPDVARQLAERMIRRDGVDFVTGISWSNVLLSIVPIVTKDEKIVISTGAGPQEYAGAECNPYLFVNGWQNDGTPEAIGKYLTDKGVQSTAVLVPNFAAGRDMVAGFKRTYKGKVVAEIYTRLDQTDYLSEISQVRALNPQAVFIFYPGGFGIQFIKQYDQAGLRGKIPLYSVFSTTESTLPAIGPSAEGNFEASWWSSDLDNPVNKQFVEDFRKAYNYAPAEYAATAYDAIMLIDSAVRAVKGDLTNKRALIAAIEKADFKSVRGAFKFNNNHYPIQAAYLMRTEKNADGTYGRKVQSVIYPEHRDAYHTLCKNQLLP